MYRKDHCRIGSLEINLHFQHLSAGDHCRIGSLEKLPRELPRQSRDHCRIGSLEIRRKCYSINLCDHCRIGSLEKDVNNDFPDELDHCRIGSLEMKQEKEKLVNERSLPHRQLRNEHETIGGYFKVITAA